jgi:hypothetical protein
VWDRSTDVSVRDELRTRGPECTHPIRLRRLDRWFLMHSQLSFEEVRVDV